MNAKKFILLTHTDKMGVQKNNSIFSSDPAYSFCNHTAGQLYCQNGTAHVIEHSQGYVWLVLFSDGQT
jgi:hypothetical protein